MARKILILEDEKDVALLYAKRLETHGYEARVAYNGLEGLEHLKEFTPDLILLDINMPEMGGLEFYQKICGHSDKPPYPVLVLTARTDLEALFRDFNVDGFITKPFNGSRLLKEAEIILKMQYKKKADGSLRTVTIVDNNAVELDNIASMFANAGYRIEFADSGVTGIDKIMANPPDLALIKLGLSDLSGDMVILKLYHMAKTKAVPAVLYAPRSSAEYDKKVFLGLGIKSGIKRLIEYDAPQELLDLAVEIFKEEEQKDEEDAWGKA